MSGLRPGVRVRIANFWLASVILWSVCCGAPVLAQGDYKVPTKDGVAITYQVTPIIDPAPHRLEIRVSFEIAGSPSKVSVQMPVWSPGDYHIQNHAKYVQALKAVLRGASGAETPLAITHPDDNTWDIATTGAGSVVVTYTVPEVPAGIFSENVQIQPHYGFVNGPSALLYLVDHKDLPALLTIVPPAGWTSTAPLSEKKTGTEVVANNFLAPDYDTLADSPIVFADDQGMKVYAFRQDGADFKVVCFRNPDRIQSVPDLLAALKTIAHTESALMGGMPTDHYSFLFDVGGFPAGLEHLNSFRIGLPTFRSPARFSSFIGHEFFHQWNVKRIRPVSLGPFDYIHPPVTRNLWFAEGVTEYYAQMCSHRGGFTGVDEILMHFRARISLMQRTEARKTVTAEDSSLRVWEAGNSEGFGGLSYYDKGELIGLCLDLKIRTVTEGKKSLDDVMRLLMKRHAPPLPGYGEDELRLTVNEVAGQDLSVLYNLIVRSTAEIPTQELLAPFGLDNDLRPLATETAAQRNLREGWLEGTKQ